MSEYRNIRLESKVYDSLQELQQVRESLSQVVARVLEERDQLLFLAQGILKVIPGGEPCNTKK